MQIGRRERKKLELRERIVDTAGALIGRQGLAQTTVDQIAEARDIAQATFFNYFAPKGALVDASRAPAETFNDLLEGVPGTAHAGAGERWKRRRAGGEQGRAVVQRFRRSGPRSSAPCAHPRRERPQRAPPRSRP